MNYQTYTWLAKDGLKLFAQSWSPQKDEKKVILLVHGLGEHCVRYDHWAKQFNKKGYTFLSLDLHGHGKSEGKRGHVKSLDVLLDDIDILYDKSEELFPGYKKILYGHSMGGALAINHLLIRNRKIDAVIITSPWLKLFKEPPFVVIKLTAFLKKLFPSLAISNQLKPEQISHDPAIIKDYGTDPLNHDRISLNMFHEIYQAGYYALQNAEKIKTPFLIMHGTADTITSPKASEEYARNSKGNASLKLWPDQYHELQNEFIKEEVNSYIISWLDENKI
jgi:alpha-beta hydrolase superfamily lysophospholipase